MRKINIDRLMDIIGEEFDSTNDYFKSGAEFYRKNGCHAYFYNGKKLTHEEEHIKYAYHADDRARTVTTSLFEVLGLDKDQTARAYIAARAVRRWYNDTEWQRLLPHDLLDRIEAFIYG